MIYCRFQETGVTIIIMTTQEKKQQTQNSGSKSAWIWIILKIGITTAIAAGLIYVTIFIIKIPEKLMNTTGAVLEKSVDEMTKIASAFKTGTILTEFKSYATEVNTSNYLQVAQLKTRETFSKTDTQNIMWDMVKLPDVTVEMEAPVVYTFYVDLNDEWSFSLNNRNNENIKSVEITVHAPEIKCNIPSINPSRLICRKPNESIFRNEEKVKEQLQREMMFICRTRAKKKINLIRAIAREEVKRFIRNWLINQRFREDETKPYIKAVYFADEPQNS